MNKCKESTLCWTCQNSVANPDKNLGCSWSIHLKPVEGWYAQKSDISYLVIDCPNYIPTKHRKKKNINFFNYS